MRGIRKGVTIAAERQKAEAELRGVVAVVAAQDDLADKLIAQISDDVWNKIWRPAFDPTFDVVFPAGISYYTGGPDAEQPERMELLAQLLEMNIIARLPQADRSSLLRLPCWSPFLENGRAHHKPHSALPNDAARLIR